MLLVARYTVISQVMLLIAGCLVISQVMLLVARLYCYLPGYDVNS